MPRAFSEHERAFIVERLMEQGYRQFSAHGLTKTSVEELAEGAGISKGAFYSFYESKEALFMDVVERVEARLRAGVLAAVETPGPSPRARLYAALQTAFSLWTTLPILRDITRDDSALMFSRVAPDQVQEHLASDRAFMEEFFARCRDVGIPIQASAEEIGGLLYAVVLYRLHEEGLGSARFAGTVDRLLELVAAYALGEVQCTLAGATTEDHTDESGH